MSDATEAARHSAAWTINGRFTRQRLTGVQRYAFEIVRAMDDLLKSNREMADAIDLQIVVPPGPAIDESFDAISVKTSAWGSGHLWDQFVLPFYARDGILSLGNFGPIVPSRHVVCIHDANTFVMPESYSLGFRTVYRLLLPLVGHRARKVVTVSQFSADMLAKHGIARSDKIVVIPNGHEHVQRWRSARANPDVAIGAKRPFVLVIGSKARHKNISVVLEISKELDEAGVDIVVAGGSSGIFTEAGEGGSRRNVRNLDYVTDDDLAALYEKALCLVFPSRIEGFGLPVLEAMACGCPVISSRAASLPEVGGDAVLYADAERPEEWLAAITQLLRDPEKRNELKEKGLIRAGTFSWRRSAQKYLDQLVEVS
jgi:glycosyltransferase involved in cell wall biosynthesis